MLVGEQPGDAEDLAGHPFVGPAGKLLDRALADAGIDRAAVYVTNAVKHFKWEPRGKRRIHKKPNARRDRRVPAVARHGNRAGQAARDRLSRRNGGAGAARQAVQGDGASRRVRRHRRWRRGARDGAPFVDPARARTSGPRHEEMQRFTDDLRSRGRALSSG